MLTGATVRLTAPRNGKPRSSNGITVPQEGLTASNNGIDLILTEGSSLGNDSTG